MSRELVASPIWCSVTMFGYHARLMSTSTSVTQFSTQSTIALHKGPTSKDNAVVRTFMYIHTMQTILKQYQLISTGFFNSFLWTRKSEMSELFAQFLQPRVLKLFTLFSSSPGAAAPSVLGESCGGPRCTPRTTRTTRTSRTGDETDIKIIQNHQSRL